MLERIHLQILKEVDACGTLTEASKRMHLTQSALSHTIKKLELRINGEVWRREGRHVSLTSTGKYLLEIAERILPQLEQADYLLKQYADGIKGQLRIGMECHPCYRWLQRIIPSFLSLWADVDIDIKQKFQFGGVQALLNHEIDLLITPDPILHTRIEFVPVFAYELVLVVANHHPLSTKTSIVAKELMPETLITYPVPIERLDVFSQFLLPANCFPVKHKTIETIDMTLQMVAANRGVTVLPHWLASEYAVNMPLSVVRLGKSGIHKHIHIGLRKENRMKYLDSFINLAKETL